MEPTRPSVVQRSAGAVVSYGGGTIVAFLRWFFFGAVHEVDAPFGRRMRAWAAFRLGALALLAFLSWYALRNPAAVAAVLVVIATFAAVVFSTRIRARDQLASAATAPLATRAPLTPASVTAPRLLSAHPVQTVALAVDAPRRGDVELARRAVADLDESRLEEDEARLLAAVRAFVALADGDKKRAVRVAVTVLPTGCVELDEPLAELCMADAWYDTSRALSLAGAWREHGVAEGDGTRLGSLLLLVELKTRARRPELEPAPVRAHLAELAAAVGDRGLADELATRELPTGAYR